MQQVLSISQVNEYIRSQMDRDPLLSQIAVRGEISNYKLYPSGHHYFTLKDEGAALKCVMFKGNALRLRFKPENGMQIIAIGKVSVYPRDGAYQLYCSTISVDGVGDLHTAFEQLKEKLFRQGLFDPAHKKTIPKYPKTIGIITSPAGAAVHDMLRIIRKRYPIASVRILPVRVQGVEAPGEISAAIQYANQYKLADLLIVGRGGGSIEDLWAFNDEIVARAIYASDIPVISAVGHEPDITISDYVADLRAATPSNAAELAVPDQNVLLQQLDSMSSAMDISLRRQLRALQQQLDALTNSPMLQCPDKYIEKKSQDFLLLKSRLVSAQNRNLKEVNERYISCVAKLEALSPLKVLARGYSITQTEDGNIVRSVKNINVSDHIQISLSDGKLSAVIHDIREEVK